MENYSSIHRGCPHQVSPTEHLELGKFYIEWLFTSELEYIPSLCLYCISNKSSSQKSSITSVSTIYKFTYLNSASSSWSSSDSSKISETLFPWFVNQNLEVMSSGMPLFLKFLELNAPNFFKDPHLLIYLARFFFRFITQRSSQTESILFLLSFLSTTSSKSIL